jgi:hypothetical protein
MTSILTETQALTRTGGTFVAVGTTGRLYTTFTPATVIANANLTNYAGNLYNFNTAANAVAAVLGAQQAFASGAALVVGALYRDMGDRIVYAAGSQTVAIFARVQALNQIAFEGSETTNTYICVWTAAPASVPISVGRL